MRNGAKFDDEFPDFEQFVSSFDDSFSSTNSTSSDNFNPFSNIDMNTVLKMKQIIDGMSNSKNNPRANLLLSLKPYLKPSRKQKIDQYIQIFNMSELIENMKQNGGEK